MKKVLGSASHLAACAAIQLIVALAQADNLDGTWSVSPLRVSWSIGDWGKNCGPRPSGGGEQGGTVTLRSAGSGFVLEGLGRNYSSTECWEQMPGLSARSRSTGKAALQTTCTMPPGDPRRATVTTSWSLQGDTIAFDETGQYQFVVSGSNCTASARRTRTLKRTQVSSSGSTAASAGPGKKPSSAKATASPSTPAVARSVGIHAAAAAPPPPEQADSCRSPGPAVHLEVTPRTKLMRPGETFQFVANARDQRGCRVPLATQWKLIEGASATLSSSGMLSVANAASAGKIAIEARVNSESVQVGAVVVSADEFDRLLDGGSYGVLGESLDAAEVALASGHVELEDSRTEAENRKFPQLTLLALLLGLVGALSLFFFTRKRASSTPAPLPDSGPPDEARSSEARATTQDIKTIPETPARSFKRLCPVCGKRYAEGTTFCAEDGARLMRAN